MSLVSRLEEAFENRDKPWPTYDGGDLDRKTVLSSSEVYRCLRWSWFEKHDAKIDADHEEDWGFAIRGHGVEAVVMGALHSVMDEDEAIVWSGEEQVSFVDKGAKVSATPDGLYVLLGEDHEAEDTCLLEVKSIDPRTNWDKLPKAPHVAQVNVAMGLVNRLSEYEVKRARIVYVDASQYTKQVEFVVDYDKGVALENAEMRADKLFKANDAEQLPAEGAMNGTCRLCPYKVACGAAVVERKKQAKEKSVTKDVNAAFSNLEVLASQYAAAKDNAAAAKEMMDEVRKEILATTKPGTHEAGEYEVEIKEIAGRRSLDRKGLEAKFGDLSRFEKVGAPSFRLTITS